MSKGLKMNLPNTLIVGAQKAGTSSLHYYLSQHHDVFASKRKELHFFDDYARTESYRKYTNHFKKVADEKIILESTPCYLSYPGSAAKIREVLGDINIIIILREPVSRAYSHYWHEVKLGWEFKDFYSAIDLESQRKCVDPINYFRHYSYIYRSLYTPQVKLYQELFSKVKIVKFEDMVQSPLNIVNEINKFLGISCLKKVPQIIKNPSRMPLSKRLNRFSGKLEKSMHEGFFVSAVLRKLNSVKANYPKLSEKDQKQLRKKYFSSDELINELYRD